MPRMRHDETPISPGLGREDSAAEAHFRLRLAASADPVTGRGDEGML